MTEPSLARRLGTGDAVVIGLGAMLGAGVFAALAPAAAAAGSLLLAGLAVAAVVATCNALSSAQLAALHPSSGGTYVYGRRQLGPFWGHLAGFGFVVGKTASCAAMALTVGAYAAPALARPLAVAAVVALTAVNLRGVARTARLTRLLVVLVLAVLALVVTAGLLSGTASSAGLRPSAGVGAYDVLQSAGLLFFAFAGYARIATLGEEVRDPERTIPRAIPLALGVVLAVYAAVAVTALLAVGPAALAESSAPLATVVDAGSLSELTPVVRAGGAIAALGVLLSLLVGVSRTAFAMAREGELPRWLDAVHPVHRVPRHAELAVAVVVIALVAVVDVRGAIGFSRGASRLTCPLMVLGAERSMRPVRRTVSQHARALQRVPQRAEQDVPFGDRTVRCPASPTPERRGDRRVAKGWVLARAGSSRAVDWPGRRGLGRLRRIYRCRGRDRRVGGCRPGGSGSEAGGGGGCCRASSKAVGKPAAARWAAVGGGACAAE